MFPFIPAMIGAVSSVFTAMTGLVAGLGPALSSFASTTAGSLGALLKSAPQLVQTLSKFAEPFLHNAQLLQPGESLLDLGARALLAKDRQGSVLQHASDYANYVAALRDTPLSPKDKEKYHPAEQLLAGIALSTVGLEQKLQLLPSSLNKMWLLPLSNAPFFTPERMQTLVRSGQPIGDVAAYLEKRTNGSETHQFEKQIEKGLGNTVTSDDLYAALDTAKAEFAAQVHKAQA